MCRNRNLLTLTYFAFWKAFFVKSWLITLHFIIGVILPSNSSMRFCASFSLPRSILFDSISALMSNNVSVILYYFAFSILIFIILGAVEFFILVSFSNSLTLSFNCKYSSVSNTILCSKISYKSIVIYFY